MSDDRGEFTGVRLCMSEDMHHDFSCFKASEIQADTDTYPHTDNQRRGE